jgi:hypothetical protein
MLSKEGVQWPPPCWLEAANEPLAGAQRMLSKEGVLSCAELLMQDASINKAIFKYTAQVSSNLLDPLMLASGM